MTDKRPIAPLLLIISLFMIFSACRDNSEDIIRLEHTQAEQGQPSSSGTVKTTEQVPGSLVSTAIPESPLTVENITLTTDETGSATIRGFLRNSAGSTVNDIQIELQVFDVMGIFLGSEKSTTLLKCLGPGQVSPFAYETEEKYSGADRISVVVNDFHLSSIQTAVVTIQKETITTLKNGVVVISGEIQNNNLDPVTIESIAASILNKEGSTLSISGDYLSIHYLDPGEIGPFQISFAISDALHPPITNFHTYIDARVSDPKLNLDLHIDDFTTSYYDLSNDFHLIGEITNKSDFLIKPNLIAGIYDQEGYIIDVAVINLPFPLLPGETLPYHFANWRVINSDSKTSDHAIRYSVQWDPYNTHPVDPQYVTLSTKDFEAIHHSSSFSLTGEFINDSDNKVGEVIIIAAIYNQQTGKIITTDYQSIEGIITVGQIVDYDFSFDSHGLDSYEEAQGVILVRGKAIGG